MKLLKTIHGLFSDEKSYILWCKINHKKPITKPQKTEKKDAFVINNNYDVEKRERVEE